MRRASLAEFARKPLLWLTMRERHLLRWCPVAWLRGSRKTGRCEGRSREFLHPILNFGIIRFVPIIGPSFQAILQFNYPVSDQNTDPIQYFWLLERSRPILDRQGAP